MANPGLSVQSNGTTLLTEAYLNGLVQSTSLASDLRGFVGVGEMQVSVSGYVEVGDGGAGVFCWSSAIGTDDGKNCIVPHGALTGCWIRPPGPVDGGGELVAWPFINAATMNSAQIRVDIASPLAPSNVGVSGIALQGYTSGGSGADWSSGAPIVAVNQLQTGNASGGGGARAAFFETVDVLGNPSLPTGPNQYFTETLRLHALVGGSANYTNSECLIAVCYTPNAPKFAAHAVTIEAQVDNTSAYVAPLMDSLNGQQCSFVYLANLGEPSGSFNKIDAAYAINPYSTGRASTGYLVPPNTVVDTAFGATDACAWGLRATAVTFGVVGGPNNMSMLRQLNGAGTAYLTLIGLNPANILFIGNDSGIDGLSIGNGLATVSIPGLPNFANDTAAAAAGWPVNALYRSGSAVQVRVV